MQEILNYEKSDYLDLKMCCFGFGSALYGCLLEKPGWKS